MADWYKIPPTFRITQREYEANIRGMNIVFGAVLGFVLAGTTGLPMIDFCVVLLISASVVISILYLGSSPYKLFYGITAIAAVAVLPIVLEDPLGITPIPQLQPTLAVWTFMVLMVEIIPRETDALETSENTQ